MAAAAGEPRSPTLSRAAIQSLISASSASSFSGMDSPIRSLLVNPATSVVEVAVRRSGVMRHATTIECRAIGFRDSRRAGESVTLHHLGELQEAIGADLAEWLDDIDDRGRHSRRSGHCRLVP